MTYEEFLKTDEWKEQRLRIKARDGFRCRLCGECKNIEARHELHAHHLRYSDNLFNIPDEDIITLCDKCHKDLHTNKFKKSDVLRVTEDFIAKYQNQDFSKGGIYNLTHNETIKYFIERYRENCEPRDVATHIEIIIVRERFSDLQTAFIQRLKNKGYSFAQVEGIIKNINPVDKVIGRTSLTKKYYLKENNNG